MPGDLNQTVYLKGLLDGIDFTVVAVTPSVPDKSGWSAGWDHPDHGHITVNESGAHDYLHLPFKVNPNDSRKGLLGHFKLRPKGGLFSKGTGGKVDVTFTVEGSATVDGTIITVPKKTGYITVSSTDWDGFARPDWTNVTYSVADVTPINLAVRVAPNIGLDPDDVYLCSGIDKAERLFGLNATTHADIINTVLSYAIQGILWVNDKLAGWATGKLKPF